MDSESDFSRGRAAAFDQIIAFAHAKAAAVAPKIITRIELASPGLARDAATREVWQLFAKGLQHLKSGGIADAPGSMTGALSLSSLRNTSLAQVLGVPRPQFEPILHAVDYADGHSAAYAEASRLAQAARFDVVKSVQILQRKIFDTDLTAIYGGNAPSVQQQAVAAILAETTGHDIRFPKANPKVTDGQVDVIRRQMVMTLEMLEEVHGEISKEIIDMAKNPPAAPTPKPPKIDGSGEFKL